MLHCAWCACTFCPTPFCRKVDYCGAWDGKDHTPLAKSCAAGSIVKGGDIHRANMTVAAAIAWCEKSDVCEGFTANAPASKVCPQQPPMSTSRSGTNFSTNFSSTAIFDFYFKDGSTKQNGNPTWSYFSVPGMAKVDYHPEVQYDAWKALGDALNATGRSVAQCAHTVHRKNAHTVHLPEYAREH